MPRLFVAVDLPLEVRARLAPLLGAFPGGRWATPEQLHVTLRFLGSVAPERIPELQRQLAAVAGQGFALSLRGIGVFPPSPSRRAPPRVLWVGLAPREPLVALKGAIDQALGPDPELHDREFYPHVTLARWKVRPGPELAPFLERHASLTGPSFSISDFHLYESRTLPDRAVYTRLHSFTLGTGAAAPGRIE